MPCTVETILLEAGKPGAVDRAAALLAAGQPVALPTETVYGLAADAGNPLALAAVFQAKNRPFFDPLIVHLPEPGWVERLTAVAGPQRLLVERLTAAFWPGPLTLLLPRRIEAVPDLVTAGSALVAVRISAHPVFQEVIAVFGKPLAAPSANRFGRISPTTGAHALSELQGCIPLVLEAGPTAHGLESTILALEGAGCLRILRHGPVTAERLAEFGKLVSNGKSASREAAPGQMEGHYAPRTPLRLWDAGKMELTPRVGRRWGLLAFRRDHLPPLPACSQVEVLSESGDLAEAAARLFSALRRLDEAGLDEIIAETIPLQGLGRAIMERLVRAAAGSG